MPQVSGKVMAILINCSGPHGPRTRIGIRIRAVAVAGSNGYRAFVSSLSGGIWSAGGVGDFTDELFEDVFECNQAACLTVLVDQLSEV
jgi:hypothetical protein